MDKINSNKKENKKSKLKVYLISLIVIALIGVYWFQTKDSLSETYKIGQSDKSIFKPGKSYINRTGKAIEEDKPSLTNHYWTGGKLGF